MKKRLLDFQSKCKRAAVGQQELGDMNNITDEDRAKGYQLYALDGEDHPSNDIVQGRAERLVDRYRFLHSDALSEEVCLFLYEFCQLLIQESRTILRKIT